MRVGRSLFLAVVVGACLAFAVPALATPNGQTGKVATAAVPFIPAFAPADLSVFPTENCRSSGAIISRITIPR